MRVQCLAPDLFPQQVSLFFQQRVSPFFRTRTTTTDQQTCILVGNDGHVLGVRCKASPRARPLLGELLLGEGLCEGLDISLHEVVVFGLITCVGAGFVRRPHLLVGGVHKLKGSRSCWRLKENKKSMKLDGMELKSRRVTLTSCMDEMSANTRTT